MLLLSIIIKWENEASGWVWETKKINLILKLNRGSFFLSDVEINTDNQVENVVTDDRHPLFEGDVTLVPRRLSSSSDGMATERIKGVKY